jgi:restriction endonuclease S subunit
MRLGDIATVRSGLVLARKQAKTASAYQYPLLNLRGVKSDGSLDHSMLETFAASKCLKPEYLTHTGDVVVRLTTPYTAILIDEQTEGIVIPSSFAIIRADRSYVLPEYLFWLLNTPKVRQQIYENTTGNMLSSVKPSYFNDFRVDNLPIEKQQMIAVLNETARREVRLLAELAAEKEIYYARIIDQAQKEMRRGN